MAKLFIILLIILTALIPANRATFVCLASNGHRAKPLISSPSNSKLSNYIQKEIDRRYRDPEFLSSLYCKTAPIHINQSLIKSKTTGRQSHSPNSVTYPVVTAHGVETICSADEHKIIVSRNQDFNEIMALVLIGRQDSGIYGCFSAVNTTEHATADLC